MKAAILFMALGIALVVSVVVVSLRQRQVTVGCDQVCRQDIASATYFGLIELDCDGQWDSPQSYSGGAQCSDELANVNRLPRFDNVKRWRKGLVVQLTFYLNGAATAIFPVEVKFGRTGEMAGIK